MLGQSFIPLLSQLPNEEKRVIFEWLKSEVEERPEIIDEKFNRIIIKHITKNKST